MYDQGFPDPALAAEIRLHMGMCYKHESRYRQHVKAGCDLDLLWRNHNCAVEFMKGLDSAYSRLQQELLDGKVFNSAYVSQCLAFRGVANKLFILRSDKDPVLTQLGDDLVQWLRSDEDIIPADVYAGLKSVMNKEIEDFCSKHAHEAQAMGLKVMDDAEITLNAEQFLVPQLEEALTHVKNRYPEFAKACVKHRAIPVNQTVLP